MGAPQPRQACQQRLSVLGKSDDAARVLAITITVAARLHSTKFGGSRGICCPRLLVGNIGLGQPANLACQPRLAQSDKLAIDFCLSPKPPASFAMMPPSLFYVTRLP